MVSRINVVFALTAAFIGSYGWELSSIIEPTGIEIGLRITNTFTQTIVNGFQILCVTDRGDDTVDFTQQNPGNQSVWKIELTYDTFGYYNVSIECFNETRAFNKSDNAYIGTAITKLDLTSGTDNIFLPVPAIKIRNSTDVMLNITFVTGLDVNITVDVLGKTLQGNPQSFTNMTNSTHIITLPYAWFNKNALYPVNVTVSNPFNNSINEQVVIAVQEEIDIKAISFDGYSVSSTNYVLVNQPFNITISFNTGENVSIVANIVAPDGVITSTLAEICSTNQEALSHKFEISFPNDGPQILQFRVSNYVTTNLTSFNMDALRNVNNLSLNVNDNLTLHGENVTFSTNIADNLASAYMGVVNCVILFLGASTDQTFNFNFSTPNSNNLSTDSKSRNVSKFDIIAGWHYVSVKCGNNLPAIVGTTVTTLTLTQFIIVENPVKNLILNHDSKNITFHPVSQNLTLNVSSIPLDSTQQLANLTCVFKIKQDSIETVNVSGNVQGTEIISYSHKFALGKRNTTITVNCSNIQTSQVLTTLEAFVYYDCWKDFKYFYSGRDQSAAVSAYTDEDKDIIASVVISGVCKPQYTTRWLVYPIVNGVVNRTVPKYTNETSITTAIVARKDTYEEGIYEFQLSTQFPNQESGPENNDRMYVKYTLKDLVPVIEDDNRNVNPVKTVYKDWNVTLDASRSVDPAVKLSGISKLTSVWSWTCITASATSLTDEMVADHVPKGNIAAIMNATNCNNTIPSPGSNFVNIKPTGNLEIDQWYVFTLTWTKGQRRAVKSQAIKVIEKEPLNLKIECVGSNCRQGKSGIVKLALQDLTVNVRILTTDADNSSATYFWKVEQSTIGANYAEITNLLIEKKGSGLKVPVSVIKNTAQNITIRVSCTVTIGGKYAITTALALFYKNLPPYDGTCNFIDREDVVITEVKSGVDPICYNCIGWRDERNEEYRSNTDTGDALEYVLCQLFINNTTNETDVLKTICNAKKVDKKACFAVKYPEQNFRSRFEVRIMDDFMEPFSVVTKDITVLPAVDPNETDQNKIAADLDSLLANNMLALNSSGEQKDLSTLAAITASLISNIPVVAEEEISIYNGSSVKVDLGIGITLSPGGGSFNVSEVNKLLDNALAEAQPSPSTKAAQKVMSVATTALMNSVMEQKEQFSSRPDMGLQVISVAATFADQPQKNFKADTLDIFAQILKPIVNSSVNSQENSPSTENLKGAIVNVFNRMAAAAVPTETKVFQQVFDLQDARFRKEAEKEFFSDSQLNETENAPLGDDVKNFLFYRNQKIIELKTRDAKPKATELDKIKREFEQGLVNDSERLVCDGCTKVYGKGGNTAVLKRDLADALLKNNMQSASTNISMEHMSLSSNSRASIVLSEQTSMLIDDSRPSAFIGKQKTFILNSPGELVGRITLTHKVDNVSFTTINASALVHPEDASGMFTYHKVLISAPADDLYINLRPAAGIQSITAYLACEGFCSRVNYNSKKVLSAPNWSAKFTPEERQSNARVCKLCFGLELSGNQTGARTRRSTDATNVQPTTFDLSVLAVGCIIWDEDNLKWSGKECESDYFIEMGDLECKCKAMKKMTFSNSFHVPPNKIDFSSVFLKFSPLNQAAVMATLILILLIYALVIIWARRQDKVDLLKWGVTPLADNFSSDNYFYVIKVITGIRPGAGTRSRVGFVLAGEEMDTGVRELSDGVRKEFACGSVLNFLLSTTMCLGDLEYIRIWHDNSGGGKHSGWYLSRIEVQDVQRNETFIFQAERWMALEKDDGLLQCVLPVCKTENINQFNQRFFSNAKETLAESHMWVSIAYRPQSSNYTRCQRVSCALAFIMLSMIANAMFFRAEGKDGDIEDGADIQVGPFRFSLKQVYTSFISALIVTPPTILLVYLFKLSKPKPADPNTALFKPGERSTKYRVPMVHDWLEKQHQRSVQLEKYLLQKGYPSTQGLKLPYQCTYLAWFLVFLIWFLCAFFIMLYSMEWGKKKSEEWLTTFFLSCFQSIFCLDPVKVVVMAVVFTVVFRSMSDSKAIIDRSTIMKKYSRSLRGRSGGMRLAAPPLDMEHLEEAKRLRQKELQMNRAIRDTILNLLMCWIIFSIAYSNRDGRSYLIHKETMDAFIAPPNRNYPPPDQTKAELPKFTEIQKQQDFFEWLNKTVLPRMFPEVDFNNETLHWRLQQFIEGGTKYRVGPPRLRQLRIKSDRCKNEYIDETKCYKRYNEPDEETGAFCIGWKAGPCDEKESLYNFSSAAWTFTSAFDIWGIPIAGGYNTYGGGGYIAKFDVNIMVSQKIVNELYLNSWVDRHTRAVALEFTLYCLQANIFTYNMFLVEFPETGGAFVHYGIHPVSVYQHVGPMGLYTLACELIYIVYLVGFTVMITVMIVQQKKAFFGDTWQVYDLVFVILGYVAIVMYLGRHVMTSQTMSVFKEDKKAFINFYHIALWNDMLVLLLGILCFMATLRLLNVLGYNKRIGTVARVFKKAASQLVWFGLFFFACFTIYCILGWLLFGAHLEYYKDIYSSLRTMFLSMIGKNRFTEMDSMSPYLAKIYFLLFIGVMVYLVLTMFLALLSKAIDDVHDEAKKDTGDEMVDFVLKKLKRLVLVGKSVKRLVKKDEPQHPAPRINNARMVYTNRDALEEIRDSLQCALISDPRGK